MTQNAHKMAEPSVESTNVPGTAVPTEVVGLINELISSQQQWQRRQRESEQLIERLAGQLETSQRSIDALTRMVDGEILSSATERTSRPLPSNGNDKSPKESSGNGELTWEMQKQRLLSGTPADEPVARSVPVSDDPLTVKPEVNELPPAPERKVHRTFRGISDEELSALGDCEQGERFRRLRDRMEARLRDAEIEISIERARIHRERRELELQQMEFEREVLSMQEEEANTQSSKGGRNRVKNRQQSRWTRFLRREKPS